MYQRSFWVGLALVFLMGSVSAGEHLFRVTLLGTGTPVPSVERYGYSTLVEAGEQRLLFDFGRGVTIRLSQLKIPLGSVNAHFLTHFHSDHTNGLPDLWLTGWLRPAYGQRNQPFVIYGPKGLLDLTNGLSSAYAKDILTRAEDEKSPLSGIAFEPHEIEAGLIYDNQGVKVIAFNNDHGSKVKPSLGYRIEFKGHTVVLSGDTKYSEEVVRQSQGVDLLVHCVTVIPSELLKQYPQYQAIYDHLSSPEQAAQVFNEAHPREVVYSHIGLNGNATVQDLLDRTRAMYQGPLRVGEDLMVFDLMK
jgi:ribonuclease Z